MDDKKKKIVLYFFYLLVLLLVLSSVVLILPVYRKYQKRYEYLAKLKEEAAKKTAESIELNRNVHSLKYSSGAVEKVAREKFGLCKANETIMRYKAEEKPGKGDNSK
ncbi:MAG: septum formation initiator family protein, partial [Victivallales bacterium]|nr:septum formation initiator family protein [Victivallales bacterium]